MSFFFFFFLLTTTYLTGRNGPAGVVGHDGTDNTPNPSAVIAAPGKIEAGKPNVELVLARRDRRIDLRLGIRDALVTGGRRILGVDRLLYAEDEEDEEEGREQLEECRPLAPPRKQQVLLE